ncbi:MAG: energy transducer TonB [Balneolaceae bacterium]|nr:MAG: energy transducer TonB [Balneolaceae bacterium]
MKKKATSTGIERNKNPNVELRNYYTILWEIGLILTLLLFILLVRIEFSTSVQQDYVLDVMEEVEIEEIVQTRQNITVPPPPRPPVPVAVPNHEIIEDIDLNIDAELDFSASAYIPPPPATQADEIDDDEDEFFVFVEQMPELIGGLGAIQSKVNYPEMARRARIQGRVHVQFIVNQRGEVENPVVVRGIGGGCDEEALRVVKEAKFVPGHQRGRPVRVQYTLPVIFILRD